jgi:hypothetical protein
MAEEAAHLIEEEGRDRERERERERERKERSWGLYISVKRIPIGGGGQGGEMTQTMYAHVNK